MQELVDVSLLDGFHEECNEAFSQVNEFME